MGNTHRQCSVQITNDTKNYVLCKPRVYIYSGHCQIPLTDPIGPSTDGSGLFIKTPDTACGAVGVFTYYLYNTYTNGVEKTIAVLFSNPYDFTTHANYYAVGIFHSHQPCDHSLYEKMYYHVQTGFVRDRAGSRLTYNDDDVTISASMTDAHQPDLVLYISSSGA